MSADELAYCSAALLTCPCTEAIADDTGAVRLVVPALTFEDYLSWRAAKSDAEVQPSRWCPVPGELLRSVGAITKPERLT
jgi:hypothetical protein